jgi:type II secretory pathway component PulF
MEFEYKAVTKDGEKKRGFKEAVGQADLARGLRSEGYFLIWAKEKVSSEKLDETESKRKKILKLVQFSFGGIFRRVSLQEKMIFCRHLALMIKAGFSLNKAFETLSRQTRNKYFASVIKDLGYQISSGKTLHKAISEHADIFSPMFISMVKVGEASGKLQDTLVLVTLNLKRDYVLMRKVRGAMTYPIVILIAMIGVGAIMMTFVLPQLSLTFSELNVPLPVSTQIILSVSIFLSRFWYIVLVIFVAFIFLCNFFFRKTQKGKIVLNFIFLRSPILGNITKKINSARFSRILYSLISGGVPFTEAIEITSNTLTNYFYKKAISETRPEIEKGKNLSGLLAVHPDLFPPIVTEMMAVGEETGSFTLMLKELATFFESEVASATKSMSSIVEPVIMIIIGIAVGIFALSIIQPIYSIGTSM